MDGSITDADQLAGNHAEDSRTAVRTTALRIVGKRQIFALCSNALFLEDGMQVLHHSVSLGLGECRGPFGDRRRSFRGAGGLLLRHLLLWHWCGFLSGADFT